MAPSLIDSGDSRADKASCRRSPPSAQDGSSGTLAATPLSHDIYADAVKLTGRRNEGNIVSGPDFLEENPVF
ncbi:hypothetical protein J6590_069663 [Homalodisca vitripennis]|nr:hypothetical protein J6590_069663 [Homalodisca vitripennis]